METNTITPELKERFKTIFLDARESSINYHKKAIGFSENMDNIRSDIMGYKDALSVACDLAYKLEEFSGLIASVLEENLTSSKRGGCLTERKITESFNIMKILIDLASHKENLYILFNHYYNKVDLIDNVDINRLDEYIDTIFKD